MTAALLLLMLLASVFVPFYLVLWGVPSLARESLSLTAYRLRDDLVDEILARRHFSGDHVPLLALLELVAENPKSCSVSSVLALRAAGCSLEPDSPPNDPRLLAVWVELQEAVTRSLVGSVPLGFLLLPLLRLQRFYSLVQAPVLWHLERGSFLVESQDRLFAPLLSA